MKRSRLAIQGTVQGVGFRPFLHRLAGGCGVTGFAVNDARGVICEVQGADAAIESFIGRLRTEAPPLARIEQIVVEPIDTVPGEGAFVIGPSRATASARPAIPADIAPCPACLAELGDPADRRFGYPFICCTDCGPRYSVVSALPYDRQRTSMAAFAPCTLCSEEYGDPTDRRFHAQAVCCPTCGPTLDFRALGDDGPDVLTGSAALDAAVAALVDGRIVAVKGLGGFQLMCRADREDTVTRLRRRKVRVDKPFALLAPDPESAERLVELDDAGRTALTDPAAPIVIAPGRPGAAVATDVAPLNDTLGVMLPSTPLHDLLAGCLHEATGVAAVCTSGNRSDEPMVIDDTRVITDLAGIADALLGHDRGIERRVDDSVGEVVAGRFRILRRARGFAPQSIGLGRGGPTVLAVGAELKNTVGVAFDDEAVLSVHIGDLEHPAALRAFEVAIADLCDLVSADIDLVAHDLHPEYLSTKFALTAELAPTVAVQHHHAHLASCLADNEYAGPVIGVTFDGLGWGADDTLWGGEFLIGDAGGFERVAHLAPVPMPDGAAAIREPWRMAVHHVRAAGLAVPQVGWLADDNRRTALPPGGAGEPGLVTTSIGRLFDAVGALCGVTGGDEARHEGQAAAQLEQLAGKAADEDVETSGGVNGYPVEITTSNGGAPSVLEVAGLIARVVTELESGHDPASVARRFHHWVAEAIVVACQGLSGDDLRTVALTGGVFQNRLLTELAVSRLRGVGLDVLLHQRVPANDGGIALGQLAVARALVGVTGTGTMGS